MKIKPTYLIIIATIACLAISGWYINHIKVSDVTHTVSVGDPIDSLNGVIVYYNGRISNSSGRNISANGYNMGKKYQCVEFVKRYYFQHLSHQMPNPWGHAKDFFDRKLTDGQLNAQRNLTQFTNPSRTKPQVNDLVVFSPTKGNPYGHVAIVSNVSLFRVELISQNLGVKGETRLNYRLIKKNGQYKIQSKLIMGWLRKEA